MSQKKEYFNLFNTLACIPNILVNKNVLIFMRNETWVAGKITNADGLVNKLFFLHLNFIKSFVAL